MNLLLIKTISQALNCADVEKNLKILIEFFHLSNFYSIVAVQSKSRFHLVIDASSGLLTSCYFTFEGGCSVTIHRELVGPIRVTFHADPHSNFVARSKDIATARLQQQWSHMPNFKLMQHCIDNS